MNILGDTPAPTTGVDACQIDGFQLNSGRVVVGSGVMLVGGESFRWSPWIREGRKEGTIGEGGQGNDNKGVRSEGGKLINPKGQFEVDDQSWGILELVWPKPGMSVYGSCACFPLLLLLPPSCSSLPLLYVVSNVLYQTC